MMKLGLFGVAFVIALMLDFGIATRTAGKNAQDGQTKDAQTMADFAKFQSYLEENKSGKKWQTGPARMDSEEIRTAFGKARFYYVFSSPPLPPGAPLPELLEEHRLRMEEYHKQFISLTIRIDDEGRMTPLHEEEDYNLGMMRVTTDEDAKICAAAILSLYSSDDRVGPGIVAAKEVTVTRSENGWSCSVHRENAFQGEVVFDKEGKVVSATKTYAGPLPS
jgi:hypothetical protein